MSLPPSADFEPIYRSRPGADALAPASAPQAIEVATGIWASPGLSNTYLLTTADGRVVVNTGMGFESPVHRANFDAVDPSATRYIILTQGHYDHVGGVDVMRDEGTQVVAQANWRHWRDDNERLATYRIDNSAFAFADKLTGGITAIQQRFPGRLPGQASPSVDIEVDAPHFDPITGAARIRAELTRLRDAIEYLHDQTVAGMNAGKDVHTLMREITLPPELDVGEGYGKVAWDIRAIWENYSGWFHHRSTTELYSVPAREVAEDLVELAGAQQLLSRAEDHLAAGRPLHAIHLAELVTIGAPDSTQARAVLKGAHEDLLAASTNFWERAWLIKQIEAYR
jgi:hypothetical protein